MLIKVNGAETEVPNPLTLGELVRSLGIEPQGVAIALNGEFVQRHRLESTTVAAHDIVDVVKAIAGG